VICELNRGTKDDVACLTTPFTSSNTDRVVYVTLNRCNNESAAVLSSSIA